MSQQFLSRTKFPIELKLILDLLKAGTAKIDSEEVLPSDITGLNWPHFLEFIDKHRIAPIIYKIIQKLPNNTIPEHIYHSLQIRYQSDQVHALNSTAELVRLVNLFTLNRIPVLSLKGPVLSLQLYGDCAARSYGDLDFLIPIECYEETDQLMRNAGYKNIYFDYPLEKQRFRYLSKSIQHFEYISIENQLSVEIHWHLSIYPNYFNYNFNQLYTACQTVPVAGTAVSTLSREDTLLYLFAHGALHCWYRLKWLCDMDDYLKIYTTINWKHIVKRSYDLGIHRALAQGVLLGYTLLDLAINEEVQELIIKESVIPKLVNNACKVIKRKENRTLPAGREWITIKMNIINLKKDPGYKLSTILPKFRISPIDMDMIPLPDKLFFLYYILRPVLIIWRNILKTNRIR